MTATKVKATGGLAVLAGGMPDGRAGDPMVVVERRKDARGGFRHRFPAISVTCLSLQGHLNVVVIRGIPSQGAH
jgi:hypothetical protein